MSSQPKRLGRWRIQRVLGYGGMGTVYLGVRKDQQAAIKVINPGLAHDPEFRTRFEREITLASRVQGQYAARVLDSDTTAETPWYATEYIEGPTLLSLVTDSGPLPDEQAEALALALAMALEGIHNVGVVHRDLKPGNVLIAPTGPVVVDFGIASSADLTAITRTGHAMGSTGWMAPEQFTGARPTPAADIFAWAATVCFAATGRAPFGNDHSSAHRALHERPDLDGVPERLRHLLMRGLDKIPEERPTATETVSELSARLVGDPGQSTQLIHDTFIATAAHPARQPAATAATNAITGKQPGRTRSPLVIAGALSAALVLTITLAVVFLETRTPPRTPEPVAEAGSLSDSPSEAPRSDEQATSRETDAPTVDEIPGLISCREGQVTDAQIKPTVMWWECMTGNVGIEALTWSRWTLEEATGTGTHIQNSCDPTCSAGNYTESTVQVRLHRPEDYEGSLVFTRADLTFIGSNRPDDIKNLDLLEWLPELEAMTAAASQDPSGVFTKSHIRESFRNVPLTVDQSGFDDGANAAGYGPVTRVDKTPLITARPCGMSPRPVAGVFHRGSAGYGVESWEGDIRELFVFPTADEAVAFMDGIQSGIVACDYDPALQSTFEPYGDLTGYPEVVFTETWHDENTPYKNGTIVWHYLRVGAAVLVQMRGGIGTPSQASDTAAAVSEVANAIAPSLCAFTVAGC